MYGSFVHTSFGHSGENIKSKSMEKYQYHIFSPYRVCPLGAHVDHQHGLVTGFAIDKGVDLWFNVREDSLVKLSSRTFEGDVEFHGPGGRVPVSRNN